MTNAGPASVTPKPPDFVGLSQRYEKLDSGMQAMLRRVAEPDDLRDTAALYRLFPGERTYDNWLRIVFLLPWCAQCQEAAHEKVPSFGAALAHAKVNEIRVLQVARAREPLDVVQLRRLAMQVKPRVNWAQFGWTLLKWGREDKRRIVEDFYFSQSMSAKKGAKL